MVVVLTADEILQMGLALLGYNQHRQANVQRATNILRFKAHYGSHPIVYAQIWEDLQTTTIPEARIDAQKMHPQYFLMATNFLARYPTEQEQASTFGICGSATRQRVSGAGFTLTATIHSPCFGSTSIEKKSVANSWRSTPLATRTRRATRKEIPYMLRSGTGTFAADR